MISCGVQDLDPLTTKYAWRLYASERWLGDEPAAVAVRERYLDWLLVTPLEALDAERQHIRERLLQVDAAT